MVLAIKSKHGDLCCPVLLNPEVAFIGLGFTS